MMHMRVIVLGDQEPKGIFPPKEDKENRLFMYQERTMNSVRSFKVIDRFHRRLRERREDD